MSLDELADEFVVSRDRLVPHLRRERIAVPIYTVLEGDPDRPVGDGFYLGPNGDLEFKFGMMGYSSPASPEEVVKAFVLFGEMLTPREALHRVTVSLNQWYDRLAD